VPRWPMCNKSGGLPCTPVLPWEVEGTLPSTSTPPAPRASSNPGTHLILAPCTWQSSKNKQKQPHVSLRKRAMLDFLSSTGFFALLPSQPAGPHVSWAPHQRWTLPGAVLFSQAPHRMQSLPPSSRMSFAIFTQIPLTS